jgi:hypothetical protein
MRPEEFSLQRRSIVERKILRLLRGENAPSLSVNRHLRVQIPDQASIQSDLEKFTLLKRKAALNGLIFEELDFAYVNQDELQVLNWLAAYQRVGGLKEMCHPDASLCLALAHCAGVLSGLGLKLPARILYKNIRQIGQAAR